MLSLRCLPAPAAAIAQRNALPTPPRVAVVAAAGRVSRAVPLRGASSVQQSVASRRTRTRKTLSIRPSAVTTSMLDASSSSSSIPPLPLAMLAGVNRHCLEVDYGGRKVSLVYFLFGNKEICFLFLEFFFCHDVESIKGDRGDGGGGSRISFFSSFRFSLQITKK